MGATELTTDTCRRGPPASCADRAEIRRAGPGRREAHRRGVRPTARAFRRTPASECVCVVANKRISPTCCQPKASAAGEGLRRRAGNMGACGGAGGWMGVVG